MATMNLSGKGRFAPPPTLPAHAQVVSSSLASWKGVSARTHWHLGDETVVDGADFYVGDTELGHIHLDGTAHVAAERTLRDSLIAARLAESFRWSDDFVVVRAKLEGEIAHALWVFELRYDALRGVSTDGLLARIAARSPATVERARDRA